MAIICPCYFKAECLNLGATDILGWIIVIIRTVLCIMGYLAASLASSTKQNRNSHLHPWSRLDNQMSLDTAKYHGWQVSKIHNFKTYCPQQTFTK